MKMKVIKKNKEVTVDVARKESGSKENCHRIQLLCNKEIREQAKKWAHERGMTLTAVIEKLLESWWYGLIKCEIKKKNYDNTLGFHRADQSMLFIDEEIWKKAKTKIILNGLRDALNDVIESLLRYHLSLKKGFDFSLLENMTLAEKKKAALEDMTY